MKTSNRILIGLAAFLIIAMSSFMIAGKVSLTSMSPLDSVEGSGIMKKETRSVDDFTGVHTSAGIHVYLTQGAKSVEVEADENVLEYVKTEVRNGVLKVGYKSNKGINTKSKTKVYVSTPEIDNLSASSSGNIAGQSALRVGDITLQASSSGDIKVEMSARKVEAGVSSGGGINLTGSGTSMDANASSGGHLYGYDFSVDTAEAGASSGGHIQLTVNNQLNAGASSGGSIKYKGSATAKERESSGGRVRHVN